jgi:hypothetical protein
MLPRSSLHIQRQFLPAMVLRPTRAIGAGRGHRRIASTAAVTASDRSILLDAGIARCSLGRERLEEGRPVDTGPVAGFTPDEPWKPDA